MNLKKEDLKKLLEDESLKSFGCALTEASKQQTYKTLCAVVRNLLAKERKSFKDDFTKKEKKQVYYMSMEFLVGTSLHNNLFNMGIEDKATSILKEVGVDIKELYAMEPDAGLGNGGLGRLASCYMDSMTSLSVPGTGFSIRYEFGIFRQRIVDGWQMEFPDDWLSLGDVWLRPRPDEAYEVKFGGEVVSSYDNDRLTFNHINYDTVMAVPYDMFISGYNTKAVNKLVLWSAKSPSKQAIDLNYFIRGDHLKALEENEAQDEDTVITAELLKEKGIISKIEKDGVKVLGNGELTKRLTVQVAAFTRTAQQKIEALGGKAEVV